MAICSTRPRGGGASYDTHTGSAVEGRERHLFESSTGGEGATHVQRRGGGVARGPETKETEAEKCGSYLTAFVIPPRHARRVFACV